MEKKISHFYFGIVLSKQLLLFLQFFCINSKGMVVYTPLWINALSHNYCAYIATFLLEMLTNCLLHADTFEYVQGDKECQ